MTPEPVARILVVDDELDLVAALCHTLTAQGCFTAGAASGTQALEVLHAAAADDASRFDVLLTDLMMPGLDGIALLRAAHDIDGALVGIVMTGHGTIDTAVEAMKGGAFDYILKPFNLSIAMPAILRALAVRRLRLDNAKLLQQVANRTAELLKANRELRGANKELEAFAHSVSHDLRQPLSQIAGFAEFLMGEKAGPLNGKQKELLGDIHAGGIRLLRLIEDLLLFSRSSQQPLEKQTVDMEALVREVLRTVQAAESNPRIELRIGVLPAASGDPSLLRQVLANLLSNAFKFSRHVANPSIDVTGGSGPGGTTYCIRDNGAGFDMDRAGRVFSIFQRFHTDAEFEGTGVGLSIVQRIVERHGGTVAARSAAGQGAAFTFTLPLRPPD
jgi:signal transduction histidine kinase